MLLRIAGASSERNAKRNAVEIGGEKPVVSRTYLIITPIFPSEQNCEPSQEIPQLFHGKQRGKYIQLAVLKSDIPRIRPAPSL
jgi:hypothetical protein